MINKIFLGALLLSIWSVFLFFGKSLGLSMLLFIIPFVYFVVYLLEKKDKVKNKKWKVLILPIILLSSTYFLYNNSFFNAINIFVIPTLFFIMIIKMMNKYIKIDILVEDIIEIITTPIGYIGRIGGKLKEYIKYKLNLKGKKSSEGTKVLKGIFISLPIVILVIILLGSADEIFENMLFNVIGKFFKTFEGLNITIFMIKLIITICLFFYLASFFDYLVSVYESSTTVIEENISKENKDSITIKILLTTLNVIYIIFSIIQIKSLFMKRTDINYSNYARKGFFQLMIVSVINFIMILIAKNQNKEFKLKNTYVNAMCIIMIICTAIILISSAYRMNLYENAYGYTILRLLVYITLFTEAILLIPTVFYIIDKPINIMKIYFTIILTAYVITNLVNINNIIAQKNVSRYFSTEKIDIDYLKSDIGIDSIPALSKILEIEANTTQEQLYSEIKEYIYDEISELEKEEVDFRSFNISKMFIKKFII